MYKHRLVKNKKKPALALFALALFQELMQHNIFISGQSCINFGAELL